MAERTAALAPTCVQVCGPWTRGHVPQTPAWGPGPSQARQEPVRARPLPGPRLGPRGSSGPVGVTLGLAVGHFIWAVGNNRLEIAALGARAWSAYLRAQQLLNLNDCGVFLSRRCWHRPRDAKGTRGGRLLPLRPPRPGQDAASPAGGSCACVWQTGNRLSHVALHRANRSVEQNRSQWPDGGSDPRVRPHERRARRGAFTQWGGARPLRRREPRHGLPRG